MVVSRSVNTIMIKQLPTLIISPDSPADDMRPRRRKWWISAPLYPFVRSSESDSDSDGDDEVADPSDSDSDGDDEVADRCSEADVVRRRVI